MFFTVSWGPGINQSSAYEDLEHVDNQTDEENEAPDDHEGEAEIEVRFWMSWHVSDAVKDAGGVIEEGDDDGDNTADWDLHLEHLEQLSIWPEKLKTAWRIYNSR